MRQMYQQNRRKYNTSNLIYARGHLLLRLWNCQSAVQKADFISGLASHHSLHFLALTETWITHENSSTPADLYPLPITSPIHRDRLAEVGPQVCCCLESGTLLHFNFLTLQFHSLNIMLSQCLPPLTFISLSFIDLLVL